MANMDTDSAITEFNRTIKQLATIAVNMNKNNADVCRMKDRIDLGIEYVPRVFIELAGPKIFEFRKEISEGNLTHFLDLDFDSKYSDDINKANQEGIDASKLINTFKINWINLNKSEQSVIINKTQTLLSAYCKYALSASR